MLSFLAHTQQNNSFETNRKNQQIEWMHTLIQQALLDNFYRNPHIISSLENFKNKVLSSELLPLAAANQLLELR